MASGEVAVTEDPLTVILDGLASLSQASTVVQ